MKRFILAGMVVMLPLAAQGHAFLDDALPKVGSTVTSPPAQLRLVYTQPVEPAFSHIDLYDAQGQQVPTGAVAVDPADPQALVAKMPGPLKPGHYEVRWEVLSVDTHHTDGHFPFDYVP